MPRCTGAEVSSDDPHDFAGRSQEMELAASPKLGKNKQEKADMVEQKVGIGDFRNNMIGKYMCIYIYIYMRKVHLKMRQKRPCLIGPSSGENDDQH